MHTKNTIMQYFKYDHITSERLRDVSKSVCILATEMDDRLPDGPEKSAGLRKLLEAKDCFVRAMISND